MLHGHRTLTGQATTNNLHNGFHRAVKSELDITDGAPATKYMYVAD